MSARALSAIDSILASAGETDQALRDVVQRLAAQPGITWAGIAFVEDDDLVLGPSAGTPDETRRTLVTVWYKGDVVGELQVDGAADNAFLDDVAERISAHVLLGWDTGGEAWEP